MLANLPLKNTFASLPKEFYELTLPDKTPHPELTVWNAPLAKDLMLPSASDTEKAHLFSGNTLFKNSISLAMAYSGHQFGQFNPQLGDGRAHLLGEYKTPQGTLLDIHLKGSGRTAFSRGGDGKSPLGPALKEFLISEAFYYLDVPTTRSLCVVETGENVEREKRFPGAVLTRISSSLIRIGHFEHFAARGDKKNLNVLLEYLIARNYPELKDSSNKPLDFFKTLMDKQARLVAQWMSLGFVHGVMNTDNTSCAGLTIDFGPCAFLEETDFKKVFSFIDKQGRYAYEKQPAILHWNLTRLAEALLFSYPDKETQKQSKNFIEALETYKEIFEKYNTEFFLKKTGIKPPFKKEHTLHLNLFLNYLQEHKLDFTLSFRNLSKILTKDNLTFYPKAKELDRFLLFWKNEVVKHHESLQEAINFLNQTNPFIIPRNHQVVKAIEDSYKKDFSRFFNLFEALKAPFEETAKNLEFSLPPNERERVTETFCGT